MLGRALRKEKGGLRYWLVVVVPIEMGKWWLTGRWERACRLRGELGMLIDDCEGGVIVFGGEGVVIEVSDGFKRAGKRVLLRAPEMVVPGGAEDAWCLRLDVTPASGVNNQAEAAKRAA